MSSYDMYILQSTVESPVMATQQHVDPLPLIRHGNLVWKVKGEETHDGSIIQGDLCRIRMDVGHQAVAESCESGDAVMEGVALLSEMPDLTPGVRTVGAEDGKERANVERPIRDTGGAAILPCGDLLFQGAPFCPAAPHTWSVRASAGRHWSCVRPDTGWPSGGNSFIRESHLHGQ